MSGSALYLAAVHTQVRSIVGQNPSLVIHFQLQFISFEPLISTVCIIAFVRARFLGVSQSTVSSVKVIFTGFHNVGGGEMVELEGIGQMVNTPLHRSWYPKLFGETVVLAEAP